VAGPSPPLSLLPRCAGVRLLPGPGLPPVPAPVSDMHVPGGQIAGVSVHGDHMPAADRECAACRQRAGRVHGGAVTALMVLKTVPRMVGMAHG
jgi:hypothetical protein